MRSNIKVPRRRSSHILTTTINNRRSSPVAHPVRPEIVNIPGTSGLCCSTLHAFVLEDFREGSGHLAGLGACVQEQDGLVTAAE